MSQAQYQTLIDAATWEFIRATDAAYPPDAATRSIQEQRAFYDQMCRAFHHGYPKGVTAEDQSIGGVPCRVYPGAEPTVLYLHGGGFVVGGLESHDAVCADIRARTGLGVVAVDYRLSPENLHPAALNDALAVIAALNTSLVLVGDSAGGNLAAACAHVLTHSQTASASILGQVLIYAGLGGDVNTGSYLVHANAPMLTRDDVLFYQGIRHDGVVPQNDPTASPLHATDFAGLPPTVAISAECDPLADDGQTYVTCLQKAGINAHSILEPGLVHGYLRARSTVPRAAASFGRICDAIGHLAQGDWPYGENL